MSKLASLAKAAALVLAGVVATKAYDNWDEVENFGPMLRENALRLTLGDDKVITAGGMLEKYATVLDDTFKTIKFNPEAKILPQNDPNNPHYFEVDGVVEFRLNRAATAYQIRVAQELLEAGQKVGYTKFTNEHQKALFKETNQKFRSYLDYLIAQFDGPNVVDFSAANRLGLISQRLQALKVHHGE